MLYIEETVKDQNDYNFKYLSFLYSKIEVNIPYYIKNEKIYKIITLSYKYNNDCDKNINLIPNSHLPPLNTVLKCDYDDLYNIANEARNLVLSFYETLITVFHVPIADLLFEYMYFDDIQIYKKHTVDKNLIKRTYIIASAPYEDITSIINETCIINLDEFVQTPIGGITNFVTSISISETKFFTYDDWRYKFIPIKQLDQYYLAVVVNNYNYDKYKINFNTSSAVIHDAKIEEVASSYINDIEKSCDTIKLHYSQLLDQKLLEYKEHQISSYNKFNDLMKYLIKNKRLDDCQLRISNDI
jgi:hypothetical protein